MYLSFIALSAIVWIKLVRCRLGHENGLAASQGSIRDKRNDVQQLDLSENVAPSHNLESGPYDVQKEEYLSTASIESSQPQVSDTLDKFGLDVPKDVSLQSDSPEQSHIIAFGSCYNPAIDGPVGMIWSTIKNQNPDRLLLLGDNIYADKRLRPMTFQLANPQVYETGPSNYLSLIELMCRRLLRRGMIDFFPVNDGKIYFTLLKRVSVRRYLPSLNVIATSIAFRVEAEEWMGFDTFDL